MASNINRLGASATGMMSWWLTSNMSSLVAFITSSFAIDAICNISIRVDLVSNMICFQRLVNISCQMQCALIA